MKLTLESLPMYCDEEGNCLLWRYGTHNRGMPIANIDGKPTSLRRYIVTELLGKRMRRGDVVTLRCGNVRCLSPDCLTIKTRGQVLAASWVDGARSEPKHRQVRRELAAKVFPVKLSMEIARDVRAQRGTVTASELARRLGVHEKTIRGIWSGRLWAEANLPASSVFAWRPAA